MTALMLSPVAGRSFGVSSGNVYQADQYGVIPDVASLADAADLANQGCAYLTPLLQSGLLGKLLGANFNATTDQLINLTSSLKYRPTKIVLLNTSVNGMSTAVGGIYTAVAKGGTAIVANTQVYTGLTNPTTALTLTLNAPDAVLVPGTPLILSLTTPQGAAATADVYVFGELYPTN